jgi:arylsulfatase
MGDRNWELYDIKSDTGETTDVSSQFPEAVKRMDAAYGQWWEEILPCLENENAVGPKVNPFQELFWKQFGGGPGPSP